MKVPCSVIQDLLPLYHDSVCSPESCALIEEHLKDCEACQEEFHKLEESPLPQAVKEEEEHKSQGLKKVKRTLRRRWVKVTAAALAAVIALASSYLDRPVPADLVAIGEVGLTGELRSVSQLGQRVSEVRRLGFTQCLIPSRRTGELAAPAGLRLIPVRNIGEAIRAALRPSE